eukprot:5195828-Lingulodinium_polyedra.AAC.1
MMRPNRPSAATAARKSHARARSTRTTVCMERARAIANRGNTNGMDCSGDCTASLACCIWN